MFDRIAWMTDFSENAAHCRDPIIALARLFGAHVSVVHAAGGGEMDRDALSALLEHQAASLRDQGVPAAPRLEASPLEDVIQHAAADLLVMGGGGRLGLVDRLLMGSTASRVLRDSPVSVLLVRGVAFEGLTAVLCALEVSPGEIDPATATSIRQAAALALASRCPCTFLSVFTYMQNVDSQGALDALRGMVRLSLDERSFRALEARFEVGYAPSAEAGIIDVSRKHDIIVMGTRPQSRLSQALTGSVVREVCEKSPIPVLVAR